jgi:uncharacterized protein YktA (UPF0223 family)
MIEEHYLKLMTVKGFIERYWEFIGIYPSHEEAYNAVEKQYEMAFGKRKYSDYTSFRVVKSNYMKKIRDQIKKDIQNK